MKVSGDATYCNLTARETKELVAAMARLLSDGFRFRELKRLLQIPVAITKGTSDEIMQSMQPAPP